MKLRSYPLKYSFRILRREWQKYILPFFSLFLTALIVTLALNMTGSASTYLQDESKALLGGDAVIDGNTPIDEVALLSGIPTEPTARTQTLSFNSTVRSAESNIVLSVSIDVVDRSFPLYGVLELETTPYEGTNANELLLDRTAAKKLNASIGTEIFIGEVPYTVRDIITREPDVLFNTFSFFPKVIISQAAFARSDIDTTLLRAEYSYAYTFADLTPETVTFLKDRASERGQRFDFANDNRSGFSFGFEAITRFLIVAVLITALLAAVNVYASITYLLDRLQQSIAVLRALGVPLRTIRVIVLLAFAYVVTLAGALGIAGGYGAATYTRTLAQQFLEITLPAVFLAEHILLICLIVGATGIAALVPSLARLSHTSPRALLHRQTQITKTKNTFLSLISLTSLACTPLLLLASFLLKSFMSGLITVSLVVGVYILVSFVYRGLIEVIYRSRHRLSFSVRSIVSWKRYDGLFGIISFTSLYIALTALFVLALTQTSLQSFLTNDLGTTVPSVYILDVQNTQATQLQEQFPAVTLFPNVSGRILLIDALDVQTAIVNESPEVDRELRREFNLTYRTNLIEGESIVSGSDTIGVPGTVSVDEDFASRANIKLGSMITVSIQGFPVTAEVTSLRSTDSRSGLPFFYFVFSPEDLSTFPTNYFGYAYLEETEQTELLNFISRTMPNVSSLDTAEIGVLIQKTVSVLLSIVFYIAMPPFVLACALIIVLVILQYATRRRDGARLLAIGALPRWIERQYLLETMSTTLLASIGAYLTAVAATWYVTTQYLELTVFTFYNNEIVYGMIGILGTLFITGLILWRSDKRPLREFLAYEDNH